MAATSSHTLLTLPQIVGDVRAINEGQFVTNCSALPLDLDWGRVQWQ